MEIKILQRRLLTQGTRKREVNHILLSSLHLFSILSRELDLVKERLGTTIAPSPAKGPAVHLLEYSSRHVYVLYYEYLDGEFSSRQVRFISSVRFVKCMKNNTCGIFKRYSIFCSFKLCSWINLFYC